MYCRRYGGHEAPHIWDIDEIPYMPRVPSYVLNSCIDMILSKNDYCVIYFSILARVSARDKNNDKKY